MVSRRRTFLIAAWLLASCAGSLHAQTSNTAPAHLAFVDGTAWLDRENDRDAADAGMPFVPGDRLSTDAGHVEIIFPDGTTLDVDQYAIVELQSDRLVRVMRGRVVLAIARTNVPHDGSYAIDTPVASVDLDGPGEYRVSVLNGNGRPETVLAVVRGSGVLTNDAGTTQLRAGQRSMADADTAPSDPESFNSARADAFYDWSQSRRDDRFASASRDHLPDDLRPYAGDLERNGSWQYDTSDGYVWYPNVTTDWQPYSDGYWSPLPVYGWTWVGGAAWAWPTHHYGRWGYAGTRWYWIPDRRWSPGWVSWGVTSGYVSWCPLGFDNRPVFALTATHVAPWTGWTVVPHDRFVARHATVRQYAMKPGMAVDRGAFITSSKAPVLPPRVATRQIIGSSPANRGRGPVSSDRQAVPRTVMPPPNTVMLPPTTVMSPPTTVMQPPKTVLPPARTATPPARTATPPDRTALPPGRTAIPASRTAVPPARTALPPTATALPPAATAASPARTAAPPATTTSAGPRAGYQRWTGSEERRRAERPPVAAPDAPGRTAPPPRQAAPRAEQSAQQPQQPPPSAAKAQPRESKSESKPATQGTANRGSGGGAPAGKR